MKSEDRIHFPIPLWLGLPWGLGCKPYKEGGPLGPASVPQPAFSPTQPSWAWNAGQPSPDPASLMPLPNTRPLIRLFQRADVPKQSSKPAIRKAAKGLTLGFSVGKINLVWIKLEGKIIFTLKQNSLLGANLGPGALEGWGCVGVCNFHQVPKKSFLPTDPWLGWFHSPIHHSAYSHYEMKMRSNNVQCAIIYGALGLGNDLIQSV